MVRDQTVAGTWHSLGSFAFAPGAGHGVDLPDLDEDVLVADAIQSRPAGAAPVAATWTPAIPALGAPGARGKS